MQIGHHVLHACALALLAAAPLHAKGLDETCHARSGYDVTMTDTALQFERKNAPPQRLEMHRGDLAVNDKAVALGARDRKRIAAFETTLRELIPKIRILAQRGVDLGVFAIREEAASASPVSAADPRLNARVDARAQELKTRIANSRTSKEWHARALNGYLAPVLADVAPLIAGDLAQKALELTLKGDLSGAAALTNRAAGLRASLETRIRTKLETLQPEIEKLCPSLRKLDALETSVTQSLPDGSRLNLIETSGTDR